MIEPSAAENRVQKYVLVAYALQALVLFTGGFGAVAALIVGYIKRDDAAGTWLESHFRWQMNTFWWALGASVIGWLTVLVGIGYLILALIPVWYIYRVAKGWIWLSEGRAL